MSWEQIANFGVLGAVLAWFMLRLEKKLDDLTKAIQELSNKIGHSSESPNSE